MKMMRNHAVITFLFGAMLFCGAGESRSSSPEGPVWYWQAKGSRQNMKLEVRLDNKAVFTTTFSIAQTARGAVPEKSYAKKVRFSFKPERAIVWSGYRDEDVVSSAKQRIECDIWMAGVEDGVITLGVSFDRPDAIVMNTLHLASPFREERSEIAAGLVIVTVPVTEKKPNKVRPATAAASGG